jgi:hypothetical protein
MSWSVAAGEPGNVGEGDMGWVNRGVELGEAARLVGAGESSREAGGSWMEAGEMEQDPSKSKKSRPYGEKVLISGL